jgi:hypothetical protein
MTNRLFPLTNEQQLILLKQALNFLHIDELQHICTQLSLPIKGKKALIIAAILHFVETGKSMTKIQIPNISYAKKGQTYPLHPDTLILKRAYKNDLKTRLFFKQLIGEYFHFTAFGIDWLNECWINGNPPTYQEFADMWSKEYQRRKQFGSTPKEEWAYINFAQKFAHDHKNASHQAIIQAWKIERIKQKEIVKDILLDIIKQQFTIVDGPPELRSI